MCVTWAKTRMSIRFYLTNEGDHGDRFLLSLCYVGCGGGHLTRVLAGRLPSRTGFLTKKISLE
uniref:Putative ovule protein n=1 Tax=Solanum chacoense TaxID=4108 RepID=A0A0V0GP74_SOLCH